MNLIFRFSVIMQLISTGFTQDLITSTAEPAVTTESFDSAFNSSDYPDLVPSDYEDYSPPDVISVRKCRCQVTELLDGDKCVVHPLLVQESASSDYNVTIKDVECGENSTLVVIPQESFLTVEGGYIYITSAELYLAQESYCFQYIADEAGDPVIQCKICFSSPLIPRCCDIGQGTRMSDYLKSGNYSKSTKCDDSVVASELGDPFNPTLYIDKVPMSWDAIESSVSQIQCAKDHNLTSVPLEVGTLKYNAQGALLEVDMGDEIVRLLSDRFCIGENKYTSKVNNNEAYFCYQDRLFLHNEICEGKACVRKCCEEDFVFIPNVGCTYAITPEEWMPVVYDSNTLQPISSQDINMTLVYGSPICTFSFRLEDDESFNLMDNGNINTYPLGLTFESSRYCIDLTPNENGTFTQVVIFCVGESGDEPQCIWQRIVELTSMAVSSLFIVATLFVYLSVADIYRRLPSKCVISESFALLISFISLIILNHVGQNETTGFCVFIGLLFYYSTLASFFWVNVICFDMYLTIKSIVPMNEVGGRRRRKWFLSYCLYGWGTPLLFVIVVAVVDSLPQDIAHFAIVRPNILTACHIPNTDRTARWAYMYGPMLVLLLMNLLLFVRVAVMLVNKRRANALVLQGKESRQVTGRGGSTNTKDGKATGDQESVMLCVKLFVVMGVTWIMEIISFVEGSTCYVWFATDIINSLRGLFIFLIFVCKRSTLRKLKTTWQPRFARLRRLLPSFLRSGRRRGDQPTAGGTQGQQATGTGPSASTFTSRKTSTTLIFSVFSSAKSKTATNKRNSSPAPPATAAADHHKLDAFKEEEEDEDTGMRNGHGQPKDNEQGQKHENGQSQKNDNEQGHTQENGLSQDKENEKVQKTENVQERKQVQGLENEQMNEEGHGQEKEDSQKLEQRQEKGNEHKRVQEQQEVEETSVL